ncbi:MAG TPA: hypothetical protein VJL84_09210 [Kiloniellales bacterium]|nr:hypothetical protein [Kiloniellales bacterium]
MSAIALSHRPHGLLRRLRGGSASLTALGIGCFLAVVPTLVALLLDTRTIDGVNVWLKPIKFMLSTGLFAWTAAWFIGELATERRQAWPVRIVVWTIVAATVFEVGYITLQGALGERSHFNESDELHIALYAAMGVVATLLTATSLLLAREYRRHADRRLAPAYRLSAYLGLLVTGLLGIATGAVVSSNQSHAVGGPMQGGGLPLFGWSYELGDLRVAHFLAIHAEQLLPLAAVLLVRLAPGRAGQGVLAISAAYVALIALVLVQALATLPFWRLA